ncbi:cupin domain-containing protein [Gilvimarinus sp. F26214L]|uniref:cupin domain-containing protein n=1 Tax=Gilvimarinus sp. DZF01 TaxID=3461371 RepID=UPI0040454AE3
MTNFEHFEAGPLEQWSRWSFKHPALAKPAPGKLFLGDRLSLSGMEVSLNVLPPDTAVPFSHRHRLHEELYLVLSGKGEFLVDSERVPVTEGSCLRIAPRGVRTWRNNGAEPLVYVVIQARENSLECHGIEDGELVDTPVAW